MPLIVTKRAVAAGLTARVLKQPMSFITKLQYLHRGYTNLSFRVFCRDGSSYQCRLGQANEIVDRMHEARVINLVANDQYLFHDPYSGNAVKKWYDGDNVKEWNDTKLRLIANKIKQLHATKDNNLKRLDLLEFSENSNDLNPQIRAKFIELVNKYADEPLVFSHTDIHRGNVIETNDNDLIIIDWEWARLASPYYDLANLVREDDLDEFQAGVLMKAYDKNFDEQKLRDFTFIATCFSYQWTFAIKQTFKLRKYRRNLIPKLKKHYARLQNMKED